MDANSVGTRELPFVSHSGTHRHGREKSKLGLKKGDGCLVNSVAFSMTF